MAPKVKSTAKNTSKKGKHRIEQEDERPNLAYKYGATFPIYNEEEGQRYVALTNRKIIACKYLDEHALEVIGLKNEILEFSAQLGWKKFASLQYSTYVDLTLEFFTTLENVDKKGKILRCRLMGNECEINFDTMIRAFGFPKGGGNAHFHNEEFNCDDFWRVLTDEATFDTHKAPNGMIKNHSYLILHKFMCHAFFGKYESNKISTKELYVLWCLHNHKKVSTVFYVFQSLIYVSSHPRSPIALGHIITGIAAFFGFIDPKNTVMEELKGGNFDLDALRRAEVITDTHVLRDPTTRQCWRMRRVVDPNVASSSNALVPRRNVRRPSQGNEEPVGWRQVLDAMNEQNRRMNERMDHFDLQLAQVVKEQAYQRYKLSKFFDQSGLDIPSPPSSPPTYE